MTSGVTNEIKLAQVPGNNYRILTDHEIWKDHGVFYPRALSNNLTFQLVLEAANNVVKEPDSVKLNYKRSNIQLQYEEIQDHTI